MDLRVSALKGNFFDRAKVMAAVDRAERRVLSRFGAFVRTRARSSIRSRKKVSAVGSPPSSHTGLLKRFLFFAYDQAAHSVVIGPAQLSRGSGLAPRLLEYGGETSILRRGRQKRARYRARPFMRPAFQAELKKMPGLFAGQVKE